MNKSEQASFYDQHREIIHPKIKTALTTKPLWRKLFWTTGRDSDEYKSGCVEIFKEYFPSEFKTLKQ